MADRDKGGGADRESVDCSIHGIVNIRVMGDRIEPSDLPDYLGPVQTEPGAEPDIVIGLDPDFDVSGLHHLGLNFAAFTADDFYVVHWRTGRPVARLPLDTLGRQLRIDCDPSFLGHPLFHSLLIVTLLAKGHVPLHASAFRHEGEGVLVVGWEKGGKTETLLAFASRGASYVGDEWVIVAPDGKTMFGLPFKVTVWDWQFPYISGLLPPLGRRTRLLFSAVRAVDRAQAKLGSGPLKRVLPLALLDEAMPSARRQLRIREQPRTLFGERCCSGPTSLDRALLVMGHEASGTTVEPIDPSEIIARMPHSNLYEYSKLSQYADAFRFAFPERTIPLLGELEDRTRSSLADALDRIPAHRVTHPYPVSLDVLHDAIAPHISLGRDAENRSVDDSAS